ncbi:MAG: flagellar hook capping protein [Acidimicrobiia bacterium]|nr:flagellar hook capping protein [Acidimicrobiia bacterium]MDH4307006.1 flagellar hook capping protein [Acidimicrobiia bacterium]MDH5292230.1 flagellar hook capping protein [Acidimicrobiia bacterium]MDH5522043.1 flagellar hook capping protein [Acidimicrobiia bacterium]
MIEGISATQQANPAGTLGGLGGDAFLQLLVAQLRYQNPMDPTDGTEFLQQTAQFTQVETLQTMADTQTQLMNLTQFTLAVGLSGKNIEAIGLDGARVNGEVSGVRFTVDGPQLEVDQQWIPIQNVVQVDPAAEQ